MIGRSILWQAEMIQLFDLNYQSWEWFWLFINQLQNSYLNNPWRGCFQQRLLVNTITSERWNVGWWNLAVRCTVQKCHRSSNVKVTKDKKRKSGILFGSRPLECGPHAAFFRERSSGAQSTTPVGKSVHAF